MTTEIAVLNKHAIALAADSAVSTQSKIFQSANKIFSLSKIAPVAIMIYSHAEFCGVPWETVIKIYREQLGCKRFNTLKEYVNDFVQFISENETLLAQMDSDEDYILYCAESFSQNIGINISRIIESEIKASGSISEEKVQNIIIEVFEKNFEFVEKSKKISLRDVINEEHFFSKYENVLFSTYTRNIEKFENTVFDLYNRFKKALYTMLTSNLFPIGFSGIVISGFGDLDIFPSLHTMHIGQFVCGKLQKYENMSKEAVISKNCNSTIVAFAQEDIIALFIEGIHPTLYSNTINVVKSTLFEHMKAVEDIYGISKKKKNASKETLRKAHETIIERLGEELTKETRNFMMPTLDTVSILPPSELANLAESLVNLTSLKRQVSHDRETVGGPTDVALISKGDGLVWIKRKHYFSPELNHHFFNNYFRKVSNGKE